MDRPPDIVLASASPRRRELLERMGLTLLVLPADVDETPQAGERPTDYAKRIAGAKCDAVAATRDPTSPIPVVGADTIVVVDDRILGKPADEADARAMLTALAGRRHEVLTAYRARARDRMVERIVTTAVSFRSLRPAELDAYLAAFAGELRGSVTNVIGLPVAELLADLQALDALPGYPPPGFGAR
jgi:septum formation protein